MSLWALLVVGVSMVGSAVLLVRVPRLAAAHTSCDDLLVVIPARNEGDVIAFLLDDLARQTTRPARIVVVDDHSTDDTADVVTAAAQRLPHLPLEVLRAAERPSGWNPKSWAMHQGVRGQERWLLFLDADVRLAPGALSAIRALGRADEHVDPATGLVSVAPRHDVGSAVEALSLPFNLIAIMGATRWSRVRGDADAAFGPCILVSRAAYVAVGGHAAVHQDLLDDVALARQMRTSGRDVQLRLGAGLVRYRMYPHGLPALVDGWSKNIASGATRVAPSIGAISALWVTASLLPLWLLATERDPAMQVWALVLWLVVAAHTAALARRVGRFGVAPVFAPLLMVFFVAIAVRSAWLLATRRPVRWKDRMLEGRRGMVDG